MNYEEGSTGIENDYRAMSDGSELVDEYEAENFEKEWDFHYAVDIINEFKATVKNEDNYADLILANNKIIEYQEIYVEVENNDNNELREKRSSIEKAIIVLSKQLEEQKQTLPLSEKEFLTVRDVEMHYSIKEEAQRKLRGRFNDPLKCTQFSERGNVYYNKKKFEKWLENYQN